jgi:hypothetical protein
MRPKEPLPVASSSLIIRFKHTPHYYIDLISLIISIANIKGTASPIKFVVMGGYLFFHGTQWISDLKYPLTYSPL